MPFFVYGIIGRFSIANKVPIDSEISYAELAETTGVSEAVLTHILRYAIAFRVFSEKRPGYISHSASSRILAENEDIQVSLDFIREEMLAKSLWVADALEKWPSADEPSQTAYLLAERSDQPSFFAHLAQHPQREQRFATSMKTFLRLTDIATQYPWDSFGSGTVVDAGGSHGEAAFSIANKYPKLKFIVQDLPQVVATAKEQEGLNVTFMAHDFFEPQPVTDAEAYIYRRWYVIVGSFCPSHLPYWLGLLSFREVIVQYLRLLRSYENLESFREVSLITLRCKLSAMLTLEAFTTGQTETASEC